MIKPQVSVIIPVFNQEKWIGRCLRSLLNQSIDREKYELIVIDDGSIDSSDYALNLFEDEIIILKNEKNQGLPNALNIGIKASSADFIVRVDADDFVNEHFLLMLYQYLFWNESADAVACDYLLVNDQGEIIERRNCLEHPIGCGIMFKTKHLFEIGLYDEDFKLHEEREMRLRFEEKYQVYRLELPLYRYRRHENNITNDSEALDYHEKKLMNKHGIK